MNPFKYFTFEVHQRNKRVVLKYLQSLPVQQLEAMGFSRDLMNHGISAWPWREDNLDQALAEVEQMMVKEKKEISELQAYTDAELHDLGLSRGLIAHAVRNGRPGIENVAMERAA